MAVARTILRGGLATIDLITTPRDAFEHNPCRFGATCISRCSATVRKTGFTLLEVLVVTAIVAVLASMMMAVYGGARERGHLATEISNLHQIGLANALYMEEGHGPALSFDELVRTGYIDRNMAWSPRDAAPQGLANWVFERNPNYRWRIVPYRLSYIGLRDMFSLSPVFPTLEANGTNVGWLLSFVESDYGATGDIFPEKGHLRRLLTDTSVRRFTAARHQNSAGENWQCVCHYFGEFEPQWIEDFCSQDFSSD